MYCVPSACAPAGRCAGGQGFYIILPGGARCAASSVGRLAVCLCLIWGRSGTGPYTTEKNGPRQFARMKSISANPKSAPAKQTRIPGRQRKKQGTMRENRTLSVYTQPTGIATARPHTCQRQQPAHAGASLPVKCKRYCDVHSFSVRVQQRKLFLDFVENFSLPAKGRAKKRAGQKRKRLPGVIAGRALVRWRVC